MRRAPSASSMDLRGRVLMLYRSCLRCANRCPELHHRATMWQYVQMSFRENAALDERNAMMKIGAAEQELADMNELHDLREAREAAARDEPPAASATVENEEPAAQAAVEASSPVQQQCARSESTRATAMDTLPGIVASAVSVIGRTDFFERALRGEDLSLTITAEEVRTHLLASQEDELAHWLQKLRP